MQLLLPTVILLAALVAFLIAAWSAVPLIWFALRPTSIRSYFIDSKLADKLVTMDPVIAETIQQIQGLGFSLLGVRMEQLPLWGVRVAAVSLASPETHTYASVMFLTNGGRVPVYFYTPFRSGGMVFTRNQPFGSEFEDATVSVKNVSTHHLSEVYSAHLARVETLRTPLVEWFDMTHREARNEACRLYYATSYGRSQARRLLHSKAVRNFAIAAAIFLFALVFLLR